MKKRNALIALTSWLLATVFFNPYLGTTSLTTDKYHKQSKWDYYLTYVLANTFSLITCIDTNAEKFKDDTHNRRQKIKLYSQKMEKEIATPPL